VAQRASEAQEVAEVPLDAEPRAAAVRLRAVVLSDAEPVAAALPDAAAERAGQAERPWPAADRPSAALPFHAPWVHPAAARPPLARSAHAHWCSQTATQ
jgi:hypothetical protein